ncbi:hypothetical protein CYMTET_18105 [Cymbomonas tetramitiformis]|uniref:Uncharacterized protein n=1 Tax=Cymbomonas tetramitiformis TaxID=36881 RepID=A0AAE0L6L9_9CHLO|nr:hypothetical protein CYMTET_18105 [Cymbomonas tetramitiformis]
MDKQFRYADLGREYGNTIIRVMGDSEALYKTMPGYIVAEGSRNKASFTSTPKSLGHQYTTLARKLEASKLNVKTSFGTKFPNCTDLGLDFSPVNCWTGHILRALSHQEVHAGIRNGGGSCSGGEGGGKG